MGRTKKCNATHCAHGENLTYSIYRDSHVVGVLWTDGDRARESSNLRPPCLNMSSLHTIGMIRKAQCIPPFVNTVISKPVGGYYLKRIIFIMKMCYWKRNHLYIWKIFKLGMVVLICYSRTQEAEAEGLLWVPGQPKKQSGSSVSKTKQICNRKFGDFASNLVQISALQCKLAHLGQTAILLILFTC